MAKIGDRFKDKTTGKIFILRMVVDNDMIVLGGGNVSPPIFRVQAVSNHKISAWLTKEKPKVFSIPYVSQVGHIYC